MKPHSPTLLGIAVAIALAGGLAMAQTAPKARVAKSDPALEAQLASAQKELDAAARRVAEINRELGRDGVANVQIIERRGGGGRPVIGVVLAPDAQSGVRIAGVTPESGAAKAGLKAGDRIIQLGTTEIANVSDLMIVLEQAKPGTEVRITFVRDNKIQQVTATFGTPRGRR